MCMLGGGGGGRREGGRRDTRACLQGNNRHRTFDQLAAIALELSDKQSLIEA